MTNSATIPEVDLKQSLWNLVDQIPAGSVVSYGHLAERLGDKTAARWVATELLNHEPQGTPCPCYRVIRKTGEPGRYAHGKPQAKVSLLEDEGVSLRCDASQLPWIELAPLDNPPLEQLRLWQQAIAGLRLTEQNEPPDHIAGLDVSYSQSGTAVAACVVIAWPVPPDQPAEIVWSTTVEMDAPMPYVTGYLSFRELPVLLNAYESARAAGQWPGLAMIDGNGRLHPRRAGLATCFSLVTQQPSVGVSKTLLMGTYAKEDLKPRAGQTILVDGEERGFAFRSPTGGKPVFASPGEGVSQRLANEVVTSTTSVHRIPEPIYWADRISREAASRL